MSISVLVNDFKISVSLSSEIITKSSFSRFGCPISIFSSGFLNESKSSSSIKKSSVFRSIYGTTSGGVGWIIGFFKVVLVPEVED